MFRRFSEANRARDSIAPNNADALLIYFWNNYCCRRFFIRPYEYPLDYAELRKDYAAHLQANSSKMAQAGVGGSYNNPLKKFKYVTYLPLPAHMRIILIYADWCFSVSKVVCTKWFASPVSLYWTRTAHSREDIPYNTVYVWLVRQYVPGNYRNRLSIKSSFAGTNILCDVLTNWAYRQCTLKTGQYDYNYGTPLDKSDFAVWYHHIFVTPV